MVDSIIKSMLDSVNSMCNDLIEYKPEQRNADGERDIWQDPSFTFANGGDCEDYSIAKMFILMSMLGANSNKLKLLYVKTSDNEPHMVLGYGDSPNFIILDNLSDRLTTIENEGYCRPVYQIDNTGKVYSGNGSYTPGRAEKFDILLRNRNVLE